MSAPSSYGSVQSQGRGRRLAYSSLLVVAGGVVGTLCRYGIGESLPTVRGWPLATLIVNVVGAFALGVLIERLAAVGPGRPRLRDVRLLVGTGFLGSFTTYSSFAVETERLLADGAYGTAIGYCAASLVLGLAACLGGIAVAVRPTHTPRTTR